jgi:lipopolysaccharide transport system permease protein
MPSNDDIAPLIEIKSNRRWAPFSFRELWNFRHLLVTLAWRDIAVRYKQTLIGVVWAVIQPAAMMFLLTVFFGRLVKLDSGGVPYPLFSYAALLSWGLFTRGLSSASTSLVTNEAIITKVYFPRLLVPIAAMGAGLIDYLIALVLFGGLLAWYGVMPEYRLLLYPLVILFNLIIALGIGFFLSVLDALYRDIRLALPFVTQLLFFATPIIYSSALVPERFRTLYWLNPMVGVIETARWSLLGYPAPPSHLLAISIAAACSLFVIGILIFLRLERKIVDRI